MPNASPVLRFRREVESKASIPKVNLPINSSYADWNLSEGETSDGNDCPFVYYIVPVVVSHSTLSSESLKGHNHIWDILH